jgi:23S rRNA (adenine-N6)-dimethyltransferase
VSRHPRTNDRQKLYGQNFLRPGPKVVALVANADIRADQLIVEIGGGTGTLTSSLAATGCRLIVIERDPQYSQSLKAKYDDSSRVTVVAQDVRLFRWPVEAFRVVGNIPFGLTTEILRMLLEFCPEHLYRADLIVQTDVARKRAAPPAGNKLNLAWAPWWVIRFGALLPASLFVPRPSVDGATLMIERRSAPLVPWGEADLWRGLLHVGFERSGEPAQRALRMVLTSTQFRKLRHATGLDPETPVSRLSLDEWLAIYRVMTRYVPQDRWPRRRHTILNPSAKTGSNRLREAANPKSG